MENLVHLVDLSFLPKTFFDMTKHQEAQEYIRSMITNPANPQTDDFHDGCMRWRPAKDDGMPFVFPGHADLTGEFLQVIDHMMKIEYGKTDDTIGVDTEWTH